MVALDPIDERVRDGLARTEAELEELAAKLSGPEAMPVTPVAPLNSDAARDAGYAVAAALGEGLRALIFADRPEKPRPQRRPWRFTSPASPAQAVAAAPLLRPVATAPPPAEPPPGAPVQSG